MFVLENIYKKKKKKTSSEWIENKIITEYFVKYIGPNN